MSQKLKVSGMSCGHCEAAVTKALGAVPGVTRVVEVSKDKSLAEVEGDASPEALLAAVTAEGYEAELLG